MFAKLFHRHTWQPLKVIYRYREYSSGRQISVKRCQCQSCGKIEYRHDRLQDFEVAEAQELAAIKAELAHAKSDLAYLATVGTDACVFCKHMGAVNAETCEESDYTCADCNADCRCKTCTGGNFEWRGISKEEQS